MPKPPHGQGARECPLQVFGAVERESALGVVFSVATSAHMGGSFVGSSASEMVAHAYARRFFFVFEQLHVGRLHPLAQFLGSPCIQPVLIPSHFFNVSASLPYSFPTVIGRHSLVACVSVIAPVQFVHCSPYWCVFWASLFHYMPTSNPSLSVHVLVTVTYCNPPRRELWLRLLCQLHNFMLFVLRYTCGLPHALGFPRTALRGTCRCCAPPSKRQLSVVVAPTHSRTLHNLVHLHLPAATRLLATTPINISSPLIALSLCLIITLSQSVV